MCRQTFVCGTSCLANVVTKVLHVSPRMMPVCLQAYKPQQKNKAVLVDVREAKYFNKGHAAGCVNVGLFRSVEGRTPLDNLKRLAMAGFAMEATGKGIIA